MDDFASSTELSHASHHLPVLVIIEQEVLPRTCILGILKREFAEFEIMGMATASDLTCVSGRDVRLVALITGDKPIVDPSVEQRLILVEKLCPNVPVVLLSSRGDEEAASTAMQRGIRGFFSTTIPIEVAIAGLRLVLAGGVYRPLPLISQNKVPVLPMTTALPERPAIRNGNGYARVGTEGLAADLTPREREVLEGLELGLPNKLIAARLDLSENTVKMHIQHIMRKCLAHNRTEAVLRCSSRWSSQLGQRLPRTLSSSRTLSCAPIPSRDRS